MERRKRVLVVDDERTNRELLDAMLTGFGHEVDLAADGPEALAKLDNSHDLILLDVMMPGIDGFEVTRRIRQESSFPDIPICMATALTGREERLHAVESGANDFISKPIDKVELKVRTGSLLRIKEAQDTIKEYRAQLEAQNLILQNNFDELEKASALKDDFVRIASHDLKNPLTCIMGFASIIGDAIPPGTKMTGPMHENLSRIVHNAETMTKIVRDFLDFQAIEDGRLKVIREPIDLNDLARFSVEQNAGYAKAKQIVLTLELAEDLPRVDADAAHIGQVVDNLVGNSIKFGSKEGHVNVHTHHAGNHVFFGVTDNGPGLAKEDIPMLFVKYARLSNKPTGGETSSGLGLAICKRMVDINGGEIGARNNEDRGVTFWFKLPVV